MVRIFALAILLLYVSSWSYGRPQIETRPSNKPNLERLLYFDVELLEVATRLHREKNVVLSPLSVKLLMGMLMEGTSGEASNEIRHALRLPRDDQAARMTAHTWATPLQLKDSSNVRLDIATHMFVADGYKINEDFARKIRANYAGEVSHVNVSNSSAAADFVNNWVHNATHGVIPTIVSQDQITQESYALLASAIYFKGSWRKAFEKTFTKCFYVSPGKCVLSTFMQKHDRLPYAFVSSINADVVKLPYKDERFAMLVMVPRGRIQVLGRDLVHENLHSVLSSLRPTELDITLPRFTALFEQDLVTALRHLQIQEVFEPSTDLSGIFEKGNSSISISNVFHSAKVIVNEEGSEAAGATMAEFVPLIGQPTIQFSADKPFMFFIQDFHSNTVLFEGRMSDPEKAPSEAVPTKLDIPVPADYANFLENNASTLNAVQMEPAVEVLQKPGRPKPPLSPKGRPNGWLPTDTQSSSINFREKPLQLLGNNGKTTTLPPPLFGENSADSTNTATDVHTSTEPNLTESTKSGANVLYLRALSEHSVYQDDLYNIQKHLVIRRYHIDPPKVRRSPHQERLIFPKERSQK